MSDHVSPATDVVPPPWTCRLNAVLWWRGPKLVRERDGGLPAVVTQAGSRVVESAALVTYTDTPVGPYSEVLAGLVILRLPAPLVHVPFIAVDSRPSRVSGRANWALPKVAADFDAHGMVRGPDWSVRARTRAGGPPLPVRARARLLQVADDGRCLSAGLRVRGTARLARVDVAVTEGGSLPRWVPSGRCWGAVLTSGTLTLAGPDRLPRAAA